MAIALRVAREGYFGGNPRNVLNARVDDVIAVMQYEIFNMAFEAAFVELNREKS